MNHKTAIRIALMLGWQDVKQAYRRSIIGPFWITASMAVQVLTVGLVFGLIFKTDIATYLPFITASTLLWTLMATTINEGSLAFVTGEALIKHLALPKYVHVVRVAWKNVLTFAHNFVLVPIIFLAFQKGIGINTLLFIPNFIIVLLNLLWIVALLAIVSTRFRDLPPIVASVLTVVFYLTPVIWFPELIGNNQLAHFLLGLNPFYHFLQLLRLPLLNEVPTLENYIAVIAMLVLGWTVTKMIYAKYGRMVAFWV